MRQGNLPPAPSHSSAGFTLVELLVVIAVIATLAAILAPVFQGAKRSAKLATCQSNLSQIGRGIAAYTSDHDGCYPNTGDPYLWQGRRWRWPVKQYVGFHAAYDTTNSDGASQLTGVNNNILACPGDLTPGAVYDRTSYDYSASFYHTPAQVNSITDKDQLRLAFAATEPSPPCATVRASEVRYATKKVLVAEWLTYHSQKQVWMWEWGGERVCLFTDGHVMRVPMNRIHTASDGWPDINVTIDGVAGKDVD